MQTRLDHSLRSRLVALGLALALLGAQGLALWHAVVHGVRHAPGAAHALAAHPEAEAPAHGLLATLADHELDSADCLGLDQLAAGAPPLALAALDWAPPASAQPRTDGVPAPAGARAQPYQARAPPVV